jgi:L-amino acid N-acyltransferase YncA
VEKRTISSPDTFLREASQAPAWVQIIGSSMWPLIESGDLLKVRRCRAEAIQRGDIVIVRDSRGGFMAHLASHHGVPVRTVAFHGRDDEGPLELVARAEAIHTRGVEVSLAPGLRHLVWALHRLYARARVWRITDRTRMAMRQAAKSRVGTELRRLRHGRFEVRLLNATDTPAVVLFAGQYLQVPIPFLKRQLRLRWHDAGASVGAFDRDGRLCGFAYLDEFRQEGLDVDGWWIRSLFVVPGARRLGLASELVSALCQRAGQLGISILRADVPKTNAASQELFRRQQFRLAASPVVESLTQEWGRNGVSDAWVVFEREP